MIFYDLYNSSFLFITSFCSNFQFDKKIFMQIFSFPIDSTVVSFDINKKILSGHYFYHDEPLRFLKIVFDDQFINSFISMFDFGKVFFSQFFHVSVWQRFS